MFRYAVMTRGRAEQQVVRFVLLGPKSTRSAAMATTIPTNYTRINCTSTTTFISRRWKSQPAAVSSSSSSPNNEEEDDEFTPSSSLWKATTSTIPTRSNISTSTSNDGGANHTMKASTALRFTAPSPIEVLPPPLFHPSSSSSSSSSQPPMKDVFVKLQSIFLRQKKDQKHKHQQQHKNQQQLKQERQKQQKHQKKEGEKISFQSTNNQKKKMNNDKLTIPKFSTDTINIDKETSPLFPPSPQQIQRVDNVIKKYFQHQQEQRQQQQQQQKEDEDNYQLLFLQSNESSSPTTTTTTTYNPRNTLSWRNTIQHNNNKHNNSNDKHYNNSSSNRQQEQQQNMNKKKINRNTEVLIKNIELPKYASTISIVELSELSRISIPKLRHYLEKFGIMSASSATKTASIPMEEAELLLLEIGGYQIVRKEEDITTTKTSQQQQPRPPVICMMGHVDHGKTTLMDALRAYSKLHQSASTTTSQAKSSSTDASNVAGTEAGGITQMISAFQIPLTSSSSKATFLDTPGHAAFSQMRHCGLHATDILILVIAADDGVKEQTLEIIRMMSSSNSKKNNIQLVVAMTKIDKPSVHIPSAVKRLENELLMHGIETVGIGGTVPIVPVSGITSEGLDTLMDQISDCSQNLVFSSEEEEGMGIVLDARMEKGVGVVAECVVRSGQFRTGGYVVVDRQHGKIRRLHNVWNQPITEAKPSDPIRLVGLDRLPNAGDTVLFVCNEKRAQELLSHRNNLLLHQEEETIPSTSTASGNKRPDRVHDPVADLQITNNKSDLHRKKVLKRYGLMDENGSMSNTSGDEEVRIPIIIKSDAHGTLHAVESALLGIATKSQHSVLIDPIRCAVGPINAADITLALESDAPIFAFNVSKEKGVGIVEGVRISQGNIIYRLIEDAKEVFASFLPPSVVEQVQGSAKVQAIYELSSKVGKKVIAGCRITDGILFLDKCEGGQKVTYRVVRGGQILSDDLRAESLKKFKEDVTQIRRGEECGLGLDSFDDIREGDIIECYITKEEKVFI